jgi:predicted dehydrogenase
MKNQRSSSTQTGLHSASTSRRGFLKASAIASTITIVAPQVLGGPRYTAPSDMINVAVVGVGGRGLQNARELMKLDDVRISAVADPAETWDLSGYYYKGVAGRLPAVAEINKHYQAKQTDYRCQEFIDYREMLAQSKNVDAILCATPDHLHANVSLAALRAGKHVYCEKPLTHNIAEARLVAEVARKTGLATQMGNQGHSTEGIRQTCEWIWSGAIGDVKEVHAWVPATRWNKNLVAPPTTGQPLPKGINWDLWCGPREMIDFHSAYAPVSWRDFWQFGCGALGDFGCHDLDAACWALDLDQPIRVELSQAGSTNPKMAPYGEIGYFDFPAKGKRSGIRIHWYSGGLMPRQPSEFGPTDKLPKRGVMFVGSEGVLVCGGAGGAPTLYPESRRKEFIAPAPTIARSQGHHRDWINAIKGGAPASSNFEYGARLTETTLLGLVALQSQQVVHWNAANMAASNFDSRSLVHGTYRKGWEIS